MPREIPRLVFTVTRATARHSYYEDRNPSLGLIFVDRKEPLHHRRVSALMRNPLVVEMMGDFYVGGIFRWQPHTIQWDEDAACRHYNASGVEQAIVINQRNFCTPTPHQAPNTRLYIMLEGALLRTTAHDLYIECRELHRLIGCHKCPVAIDECVRRHLKFDVGQAPLPHCGLPVFRDFTSEAFEERRKQQQFRVSDIEGDWQYWKTEIEGHVYIPPSLPGYHAVKPGRQISTPFGLSFRDNTIESNQKELSERSTRAAATRRTKRTECTKCYLGGEGYRGTPLPCSKYAPCFCEHGAWTEEQLLDETLGQFEHQLMRSNFTWRDFERMLAVGGEIFYHNRCKFVVAGLTFQHGSSLKIAIRRVAAGYRDVASYFSSIDEFLPHLPENLRRIFDEAPPLSRNLCAVAAQLTCARALAPYSCAYAFCQAQPHISHLRVARSGVAVEVGYWLRSYWRSLSISSLSDLYSHRSFNCLPMFDVHYAPKKGVLDFRFVHWPRR